MLSAGFKREGSLRVVDFEKAMAACAVGKDAAPFIHPRMQSIQAQVNQTVSQRTSRDHNLAIIEKLRAAKRQTESEPVH